MISEHAYIKAAQELEVEIATIKAVAEVESKGEPFLPDGRPKVLFEAHHFSRLTKHIYDITHPRISSRKWNRKLYTSPQKEHFRLESAVALDRKAALQSASWGMFQIMGFNYAAAGFPTVQKFVNAMYGGEEKQFAAFVQFIKNNARAHRALQRKKWSQFAEAYNGSGYKLNRYDVKLEEAYKRYLH